MYSECVFMLCWFKLWIFKIEINNKIIDFFVSLLCDCLVWNIWCVFGFCEWFLYFFGM